MATRRLPDNPSLEHLKGQARTLQRRVREGEAAALAQVRDHHPRAGEVLGDGAPPLQLADAQLVLARGYGFPSWARLRRHVDLVDEMTRNPHQVPIPDDGADPAARLLVLGCLTYGSDDVARHRRANELLRARPDLSSADVWTAAAVGDVDALRRIVEIDPDAVRREGGPFGWVPLLYLAYSRIDSGNPAHDHVEAARVLLAAGADPDAGYLWAGMTSPFTALTGAFGEGEDGTNQPRHRDELALARLLLEAGADPNDAQTLYNRHFGPDDGHLHLLFEFGLGTGGDGPWFRRLGPTMQTPQQMLDDQLVSASANGHVARVRLLLDHGANPDGVGHPNFRGQSAYQLAVARGHTEIAEALLSAGATRTAVDPIDVWLGAVLAGADGSGDPDMLAAAKARRPAAVLEATSLRRPDAVRRLVGLGFDVDAKSRLTALHQAAHTGDLELVDLLLDLGADPAVRDDSFDATPLGWAIHNNRQHVVERLRPLTPDVAVT